MKLDTSCSSLKFGAGLSSSCVCDFTASETGPHHLNATDIEAGELYGFAVRIDSVVSNDFSSPGPLAFVGAPGYNSRRGRVHVFSRNSASGCILCPGLFCAASWDRITTISYAGSTTGDYFGSAIALARPTNRDKRLAVVVISAPLANRTGRVYVYWQNADKVSFDAMQVLAPYATLGACGPHCSAMPLFGTAIAISQEFLAVGCPLCWTTRGVSGAVYLYRWQSGSNRYQPVQILQPDLFDSANGLLFSSSLASISVHDGSSFGSSLSLHVSNGGILTLAVAAMHCGIQNENTRVMSAGAVFIFFAEIIPFQGQLQISLLQRQIISPMSVGFSVPPAEYSLGRSVSISFDGKSLGICGGVGFCETLFTLQRSGALGSFTQRSTEDFTVLKEAVLYQSFHTASISQDRVAIVGNPFYNAASGAVFLSSPVHLGFQGADRNPASPAASTSNFDFEIRSPWLNFFYGAPNYNATYFY